MANFLEIQKDIQTYLSDTSSDTLALIKTEVNQAVAEVLQKSLWRFSIRQTTITTANGTADYYFPADFGKVISFTQREDDLQMGRIWVADFDRLVPDPTNWASGRPKDYMELLDERVLAQPTTTAKVTFNSDSAQDIAGQTGATKASIYGVSGSVDRYELVSLSGANFLSTTNTYSKLYSITTNLSCAGNVVFYEGTVGTVLLRLYAGETERSYKKFKLFPTPDAAYTLYLTYQAENIKLINDSDSLLIPSRYHDVIKNMVIGKLLLKQGDQKAAGYLAMATAGLDRMMKDEDLMWDYVPSVRIPTYGSLLNSDYPFVNR